MNGTTLNKNIFLRSFAEGGVLELEVVVPSTTAALTTASPAIPRVAPPTPPPPPRLALLRQAIGMLKPAAVRGFVVFEIVAFDCHP